MNQIYNLAIRVVTNFNRTEKKQIKVEDVQLVDHNELTYLTVGSSNSLKAVYRYITQQNVLKRMRRLPKGFPGTLGLLLLVLLMSACQSTYLKTKPDETNFDRFTHKQHIEIGMTQKEVMTMFGSPQQVQEVVHHGWKTQFTYYRAVYCDSIYCFVEFDQETNEVTDYTNFRMEYSNLVKVD